MEKLAAFAEKAWDKSTKFRKSAIPGLLSSHLKGMNETLRATTLRHADLLLEYAARWRPRVAIIDEAHTLDPEIARSLLNSAQNVNSEGAPFLLVLAGTPQLAKNLAKANASFWERCKEIGVGRLSDEATRKALEKPLAEYGVSFAPETLDAVVEESQRYPYFIQLWGDALARALPDGARMIDLSTVEEARKPASSQRTNFYMQRRKEIWRRGLLQAAESVAGFFARLPAGSSARDRGIVSHLETSLGIDPAQAFETFETLGDLGYLWEAPGEDAVEPGIPSLMRHILERSESPAPETDSAATP